MAMQQLTRQVSLVQAIESLIPPVMQTALFFADTGPTNATKLIGRYDIGVDFEIALQPSKTPGNTYTYRHTDTHLPLHAFILGEVASIEVGENNNVAMTIRSIRNSTFKTRQSYINDALTLIQVIDSEFSAEVDICAWAYTPAIDNDMLQCEMYISCGSWTEFRDGQPAIGDTILAEVTLNRHDQWAEADEEGKRGMLCTYTLHTHYLEAAEQRVLAERGIIFSDNEQAGNYQARSIVDGFGDLTIQ
ncbi:hypothetical protein C8J57DRAFT_1562149 [Mycena rebaudengoi]|nr:hypothetical protein C8J57DRAFT_1562149 [Mycena rebaudengoi]